ncbi:MAG: Fructose-bisphosphate aldolase [Candidatus Woesebacteria bacterium GW2011_GWB1_43_14]|uniref:Probable fructose-bisphosphate aldolase class 1 n=1 Tax=Candidatus Woesebacteria bacterium GW2011_GWB1_43_14 TaxID=1618578 RepID=A0A0G1GJF8_9BACT|nr:MAG: hypothetical protein UV51_C0002G0007 [Candidatus Woesebacteria bacterium GW2011_GWC1_42_9]KKS98908.1 MAG: Fructose-bisphosphate aldolase [Candidatus Woesebacteria bacterium GW2011_GWB1_43_14]
MDLIEIAHQLVAPSKGILAADESLPTIKKRFDKIGIKSTPVTRHSWRELLFSTREIEKYISGVILFEETLQDKSLVDLLLNKNIIVGIKVDAGKKSMPTSKNEVITEGLNDLKERLPKYKKLGAQFTKWRAVYTIAEGLPSHEAIYENANLLGRFAILSQEAGMVPIVEPEVLMDGSHDISTCAKVTERVLKVVFEELGNYKVNLKGMLLKPNMVLPGEDSAEKASPQKIAKETARVMSATVPKEVSGLVFLSGGQSADEATKHLSAINALGGTPPWELSFSFGRALQSTAMKIWKGDPKNLKFAQEEFLKRCRLNSEARFKR